MTDTDNKQGEQLTEAKDIVILDGVEVTREKLSESMKAAPASHTIRYIKVNEQGLQEYRTLQRLMD